MSKQANPVKEILSDFFGYLKYKVDNDRFTLEEEQALIRLIENNIPLVGTSEDFAKYYNQPQVNVRSVITRRMLEKPKRMVVRSFSSFCKIIPSSWRKRR